MPETSISDFLNALENSQLLTDAQLVNLRKQLAGNSLSADELANLLVSQKRLTSWQAKQLLKGQTGFVLQRYRLLNPIGRGGMGHVFRAQTSGSDRVVAVKVMARKLTGNETLVSRFRREIRASSKLNSPHIVKTMDAGRVGNVDFMVMEYVNGDQVDRIANRLGRVPVGLSCEMMRQVAIGLQHAHAHQMVHRDIKPGNMMVHWDEAGHGIVKLMDMGLVLLMADDSDEKTVTRAGQVMGTPDYMSPEQGWDTTQVDIRSDIYSLGCTLFRLLTGKIPFTGTNPLQVLSQRLQRDAPSVLTVCDDIPEEIAAIVSKMTMRDPDARYQTPQEVADALAAVSEPLTLRTLKAAAQAASSDPDVDVSQPTANDVDDADGTYRQFLKEVQDGSEVDLLLATDSGASPTAVTAPILDFNVAPATNPRSTPERSQTTGFFGIGIATAGIALLVLAAVFFPGGDDDDSDLESPPVVEAPTFRTPEAVFAKSQVVDANPGKVWTWQPKADVGVAPENGQLLFETDSTAPKDLKIDPQSGAITWNVPMAQPTSRYSIPVRLVHVVDEQRDIVAETTVQVSVVMDVNMVRLPDQRQRPLIAEPETPFTVSVSVDENVAKSIELSYKLPGTAPRGLTLDSVDGTLHWTPLVSQLGRHHVDVAVYEKDGTTALDTTQLTLFVMPTELRHVFSEIPPQQAIAGQPFRFDLPKTELRRNPRNMVSLVIEAGPDAPPGLTISADSDAVLWDVPQDASGVVRVTLVGRLEGNAVKRPLKGSVMLEVNIAAATSPKPKPSHSMPPADEIKLAVADLLETYGRSVAQARTAGDKITLANRLLLQCYDAESGVTDAALLQIIEEELATKARATDLLLEIARLRTERYGTDEFAAVAPILQSFRKTGLNQLQQDLVIEHGLRLAKATVEARNFTLTTELMRVVKSLMNRSATGSSAQLAADVTTAEGVAAELAEASDSAVDTIKAEELARLLERWQFKPIFRQPAGRVYIQASPTVPIPGDGRDLWKTEGDRLRLKSETQASMVGFLDPSLQLDRYVVRFQLLPGSNCVNLVFGASGTTSDNFNAYAIVLNPSGLGKIHTLRNSKPLNEGKIASPSQNFMDVVNVVEVAVDGPLVAVRLNGTLLSQARIPELTKGLLGLAADLKRPDPQLIIRQPRILLLPESQ